MEEERAWVEGGAGAGSEGGVEGGERWAEGMSQVSVDANESHISGKNKCAPPLWFNRIILHACTASCPSCVYDHMCMIV